MVVVSADCQMFTNIYFVAIGWLIRGPIPMAVAHRQSRA